jgi:hypothetical protein
MMKFPALLIFSLLYLSLPAQAQETGPMAIVPPEPEPPAPTLQNAVTERISDEDNKNYLSLSYENDLIGSGTDSFYTSGVRATWFNANTDVPEFLENAAELLPGVSVNPTTGTFFSFGQNLYTPADINIAEAQDADRPWAGFLYASAGIATLTDNHVDEFELTLGIVGPEALGEPTQSLIHEKITDSPDPQGWDNQLEFEPGLIASWQRRWPRAMSMPMGNFLLNAEPNINMSLGNIYTYAGTGMIMTFGPYKGRFQDMPPRVRPAIAGSGFFETPHDGWSWYLFAGVDGRAVARNIFLDGNTFKDSASIDKKHFVGDAVAGLAVTISDYRLSYSYNVRSKEFDGQDDSSAFGSLTLTTRF